MIRILIVHEIRLMCNMIGASLQNEEDIKVVGCATSLDEAKLQAQNCDVILVSCGLPDQGALHVTRAFRTGQAKVIAIGLPESGPAILRFVEAGAVGYVCRDDSTGELVKTMRAVHRGHAIVSPEVAAALIARTAELAEWAAQSGEARLAPTVRSSLTEREREVLALVAQGFNNQEIARHLTIELGTVKNHVHNILKKLDVSTREEAASCLPWIERANAGSVPPRRESPGEEKHFPRPARPETLPGSPRPALSSVYA